MSRYRIYANLARFFVISCLGLPANSPIVLQLNGALLPLLPGFGLEPAN